MTLKEIQDKFAALKANVEEFGTALKANDHDADDKSAAKCNKSAAECTDGDCGMDGHGKAKKEAAAKGGIAVSGHASEGAPEQPSTDGIGHKFVAAGKDDKGNVLYTRVDTPVALKAADIRAILKEELSAGLDTAVAAKMAPIESAMETLTTSIARLSGVAIPTAVRVRDGETTNKTTDGKSDAAKSADADGTEDAAKVMKEKGAVAGVAAIHRNGPSMVLTNRGMIGNERIQ